ncbi:MAG: efflux transporter periplasmic adaptor subunit, partial [Bacteroidota bacterium]
AQVEIFTERVDNAVTIPIQAVTIRKPTDAEDDAEPEEVVFTIDKNRVVTKRAVKTGISDDTYIEIQAGLQAGESIVSGPYKMLSKVLKDGQKVRLQRKEKEKK